MSDPMFLRNMISNSVYAEQVNSAQLQGQATAREQATRARQEAVKHEQAQINGLEDANKPGVKDRERRNQQASQDADKRSGKDADDRDDQQSQSSDARGHIDFTV